MDIVELATNLHGHLAPGVALGVRMTGIALERLDTPWGNKKLIGVSETGRCLADALQAAAGCTLGHGNAMVVDYGKLAITLGRVDTKKGVRVALRKDAFKFSPLMEEWMMRRRKLEKPEEALLADQLLKISEEYLTIDDVALDLDQNFENAPIVKCDACGDLMPDVFVIKKDGKALCKVCAGEAYYRVL